MKARLNFEPKQTYFPYPFGEFVEHFDVVHGSGELKSNGWEHNVGYVNAYIRRRYRSRMEASYKAIRFLPIMD